MLRVENISKENLEDVFNICSLNRSFASAEGPIQERGRAIKRQWLLDMLDQRGPPVKIAYLDERPVAQILFYPEETIPYIHNPRKDVIYLKCIYSPFPDVQRKGVGAALMRDLVEECHAGLRSLGGGPASFVVTQPFPHEGDLPLREFYAKYGFKQGHREMFLEVKGKFVVREIPEYSPLPEDRGKIINTYNPDCEWGYYAAVTKREIFQSMYPDTPIDVYNSWENPEEYMKRPHLPLTSGSTIVNTHVMKSGVFWTDREAFFRLADEALRR